MHDMVTDRYVMKGTQLGMNKVNGDFVSEFTMRMCDPGNGDPDDIEEAMCIQQSWMDHARVVACDPRNCAIDEKYDHDFCERNWSPDTPENNGCFSCVPVPGCATTTTCNADGQESKCSVCEGDLFPVVNPSFNHVECVDKIFCKDCPADKPDMCGCGVCGSFGNCTPDLSCDANSQFSIDRGFFACKQGPSFGP